MESVQIGSDLIVQVAGVTFFEHHLLCKNSIPRRVLNFNLSYHCSSGVFITPSPAAFIVVTIIIVTITISRSSNLSSWKGVELAAEGSLCGSIVLQLLGVRLCGQHLCSIIKLVCNDQCCNDYLS